MTGRGPAARAAVPSGMTERSVAARVVASLVLAGLFAWGLRAAGVPVLPREGALDDVRWGGVASFLALVVGSHLLRAWRWRLLLADVGAPPWPRLLAASTLGLAAVVLLPLRLGEIVRPTLIRDERIGWLPALGTVAAERVIDGLVVAVTLGLALVLAPPLDPPPERIGTLEIPPGLIPRTAMAAAVVFGLATVALVVVHVAKGPLIRRLRARGWDRPVDWIEGATGGIAFVGGPRLPQIAGITVGYWLLIQLAHLVLAQACGIPLSYGQTVGVVGVVALGGVVPAGPGLFGVFQASGFAGLAMYLRPDVVLDEGATWVFLLYSVQIAWYVVSASLAGAYWLAYERPRAPAG